MAPKRSKAKAKPKEAAPPAVEEEEDPATAERRRIFTQRRNALKWAKGALESVQIQCRAAEKAEIQWLADFHGFHEVALLKIVRRLDEKSLDDVPEEAREKIAAYMAQSAKGPTNVDEAIFQPMADIWTWAMDLDAAKYERPQASAEEVAATERIEQWNDGSASGMAGLIALMRDHAGAPSVQQMGLIRMGALCPEEGKGDPAADVSGMTSVGLVPTIDATMRAHDKDVEVLRGGYAALLGLAMIPGQMPKLCELGGVRVAVEMLNKHYKDEEVAATANRAFYAMATNTKKNSPELKELQEADVQGVLQKVMTHHAWNNALCGKVRLTFPFLTED